MYFGITGCVLAKDEENNILDCLNSFNGIADSTVVIDNGSADQTAKLAQEYGANVYNIPMGIESELRNLYIQYTQTEWILVLDADERLYLTDSEKIYLFNSIHSKHAPDAFCLPIYNYYGDGKWSMYYKYVLFNKNSGVRYFETPIHPGLIVEKRHIDVLYFPIHHFDALLKERSIQKRIVYREKLQKTLSSNTQNYAKLAPLLAMEYIVAKQFDEAEKVLLVSLEKYSIEQPMTNLFLAYLLEQRGDYSSASNIALKVLNFSTRKSIEGYRINAAAILTNTHYKIGNVEKAIYYAHLGISEFPLFAHNYINLAFLLKDANKILAKKYMEKACILNPLLTNKKIYETGSVPNIYSFQSVFIDELSIKDLSYELLNDDATL